MADFKSLVKEYVNKDYDELLSIARQDVQTILPFFNSQVDDGNGVPLLLLFIGTSLATDGKLASLEYKLLNDIFGVNDYDTALAMVQAHYSDDMENLADELFDSLNPEQKAVLLQLCLCLMAVDETVTASESAFLIKLMQ